jgi:hypothetical protein
MKLFYVLYLTLGLGLFNWLFPFAKEEKSLEGAWNTGRGIAIITPNYLACANFSASDKKFNETWGGTYTWKKDSLIVNVEFSSKDKAAVGKKKVFIAKLKKDLNIWFSGVEKPEVWKAIAEPEPSSLTGLWQITGRMNNGQFNAMPKAARKTIKIFSRTRFQWAAINTQTGDFSGTGGGTYTLKDGKYTETLDFFSRDSSRVGMSLSFDALVEGNKWTHSGKSSTGNPVNEIWEKQ